MDGVDSIREVISRGTIYLQKRNGEPEIFDHVDAFVNLCREDETVQEVVLFPAVDPGDNASGTQRYTKSKGIGTLQALRAIVIRDRNIEDDEEGALFREWEILPRILRRLRRGIHLRMHSTGIQKLYQVLLERFMDKL
jgi:hypothetical protein